MLRLIFNLITVFILFGKNIHSSRLLHVMHNLILS